MTIPRQCSALRKWLVEPILFGYAAAGAFSIHVTPSLESSAALPDPSQLHFFAMKMALALAAWRICLGPAIHNLLNAARSLGHDDDDQHDAR